MMKLAIDTAVEKGSNFSDFILLSPGANLQNETPCVLKRSRPGNGRHIAINSELVLDRS